MPGHFPYTAENGRADVVRVVISRGARANSEDGEKRTPLSRFLRATVKHDARYRFEKDKAALELLLEHGTHCLEPNVEETVLGLWKLRRPALGFGSPHMSPRSGFGEIYDGDDVKELMDPFLVVKLGLDDVIYLWLRAKVPGFTLNGPRPLKHRRDQAQRTLLHEAVDSGHTSIAEDLLENGADTEARDGNEAYGTFLSDLTCIGIPGEQ